MLEIVVVASNTEYAASAEMAARRDVNLTRILTHLNGLYNGSTCKIHIDFNDANNIIILVSGGIQAIPSLFTQRYASNNWTRIEAVQQAFTANVTCMITPDSDNTVVPSGPIANVFNMTIGQLVLNCQGTKGLMLDTTFVLIFDNCTRLPCLC